MTRRPAAESAWHGFSVARSVTATSLEEVAGRRVDVTGRRQIVTLIWFVVWFVCNAVGDREPLVFDPVNWWAGTLLLAVALDLASRHAAATRSRSGRARHGTEH